MLFLGCGPRSHQSVDRIYSSAQAKLELGELDAALADLDEGRISPSDGALWKYKFRLLKSEILLWNGKAQKALELVDSFAATGLPPEVAIRRQVVRGLALSRQREPEAEKELQQAEALALKTSPALMTDVALAKGILNVHQGNWRSAEEYLRTAVRLAGENGQEFLKAEALGSLGWYAQHLEHYDEAIGWSKQAAEAAHSIKARLVEQGALLNLAWSYMELGDLDGAIPKFKDVEQVGALLGSPPIQEVALRDLGKVYLLQRQYSQSSDYYQKALKIAQNLKKEPAIADSLDGLALVALATGKLDEADKYNQESLTYLSDPGLSLTTAKISHARKDFPKAERLFQELIRKGDQKSLSWQAEAELAILYAAQGRTQKAEQAFQNALGTLDEVRSTIGDTEHRFAFSSTESRFYDAYIQFLVAQRIPVKALQVAELIRARTLSEGLREVGPVHERQLQISNLKGILKRRNQVVLSYWLAAQNSFLWVVTPSDFQLFILPPEADIEREVENYRKALLGSQELRNADNSGETLYRMLVEPAEKMIPQGASVIVVPDGKLTKLNFETLRPHGMQEHYWIEDFEISNASSIALMARAKSPRALQDQRLLIIGDPNQATPDYPALAHAGDEVKRVTSHFSPEQSTVFTGANATPLAYGLSHPGQFGMIHFVTHGTASDLQPLESAIILSGEKGKETSYKLYARDIIGIPIHANIVTISACYGAGERVYGEGLVGLAWAFMRAGAHQVIAGLWAVDDRFTPELMDLFYNELHNGKSAAEALRSAKLAMLHSGKIYRFPYYWATLQLYTSS